MVVVGGSGGLRIPPYNSLRIYPGQGHDSGMEVEKLVFSEHVRCAASVWRVTISYPH